MAATTVSTPTDASIPKAVLSEVRETGQLLLILRGLRRHDRHARKLYTFLMAHRDMSRWFCYGPKYVQPESNSKKADVNVRPSCRQCRAQPGRGFY